MVANSSTPAHAAIAPTPYEFSGSQVTLAGAATGGPTLMPGTYRTQLPNDGSPRSFQINRNLLRSFMASVLTYEKDGSALLLGQDRETEVKLTNSKGNDCGTQTEKLAKDEPAGIVVTNIGVDDDENVDRNGYFSSDCREATTLTLTIIHKGAPGGTTDAEILLTDEPKAVSGTGAAATPTEMSALRATAAAPKDAVDPGTGFGSAATLTPGTYPLKLKVGARIFYRVRLEWGQRLAATMTVPAKDSNFGSPLALETTISTWSPQRVFLDIDPNDYNFGRGATLSTNSSEVKTIGTYTAAVRWGNRNADSSNNGEIDYNSLPFTTVPGWYYITVNIQPKTPVDADTPLPDTAPDVPAQLSLMVAGSPQQGPRLVDSTGEQAPVPPAGEMSVGNGVSQDSPFPWAKAGLSTLAVLAAAAAVVWALRRKPA